VDILDKITAPSSSWSVRNDSTFKTIPGSIRGNFQREDTIHKNISDRALCQRIGRGKLGFNRGSRRIDCCELCPTFDKKVLPVVKRTLGHVDDLNKLLPDLFAEFELAPGATKAGSAKYLLELRGYIFGRGDADEVSDEARALQTVIVEELTEHIVTVGAYTLHFTIRGQERLAFREAMANPKKGHLYLCLGFQALLPTIKMVLFSKK
jgi:hypothetical protein